MKNLKVHVRELEDAGKPIIKGLEENQLMQGIFLDAVILEDDAVNNNGNVMFLMEFVDGTRGMIEINNAQMAYLMAYYNGAIGRFKLMQKARIKANRQKTKK